MKRKTLGSAIGSCLLAVALAGCGTVRTVSSGVCEPYSGAKLDAFIWSSRDSSCIERAGAFVDFPLSFTIDFALLPFTGPTGPEQLISLYTY